MLDHKSQAITEDEAALYDRQIRLWGLDAQKRLRASSVLVCGLCGLGAEVTKNLVLAGVKSITLMDHQNVTELDVVANFLAPSDSVGSNIAEASVVRAQNLNPMVQVTALTEDLATQPDTFFSTFDVVVITRCSDKDLLIKINDVCRSNNSLFYAGGVHGLFGYMFADLNQHNYIEEQKETTEVEVNGEKQKVEGVKMNKKSESFVSLSAGLEVDWTNNKYASRLKRISSGYFIMQVLLEFYALHKRMPAPSSREADRFELLTVKHALLTKMEVPQEKLNDQFADLVFGQVSPVCAIVGGEVAAEVIKAVSKKDLPHNNFFFFSTLEDGAGVVQCIGA
uniref:SUMO-activating enzyme subunit 1 n=2 Tax=Hirondellea gigas TaxID=1518452 RepID=A0A2P2HZY8_9CRUS